MANQGRNSRPRIIGRTLRWFGFCSRVRGIERASISLAIKEPVMLDSLLAAKSCATARHETDELLLAALQRRLCRNPYQFDSGLLAAMDGWTEVVVSLRSSLRVKEYPYSLGARPGISPVSGSHDDPIPEVTRPLIPTASDRADDGVVCEGGAGRGFRPPHLRLVPIL
jgi:hypothetical protein